MDAKAARPEPDGQQPDRKEAAPATPRMSIRKIIKWLTVAVVVLVAIVFGYRYWHHGQLYASTDNAYLNAKLLERLLGYPILTTGIVMAPRGMATAVSMLIVGRLVGRVDPRLLVGSGMLVSATGSYAMTNYSLDINVFWIIWPALLQGLGMGLIFVPLSTIAYATLPRSRMAEAAGIYSLVRTMGSAVGIPIVTTVMSRQAQVLWNELGAHVTRFNPAVQRYLQGLHLDSDSPQAAAVMAQQVGRQAQMLAMLDVFQLITWSFLLMLPLVFLLRRNKPGGKGPTPVAVE